MSLSSDLVDELADEVAGSENSAETVDETTSEPAQESESDGSTTPEVVQEPKTLKITIQASSRGILIGMQREGVDPVFHRAAVGEDHEDIEAILAGVQDVWLTAQMQWEATPRNPEYVRPVTPKSKKTKKAEKEAEKSKSTNQSRRGGGRTAPAPAPEPESPKPQLQGTLELF